MPPVEESRTETIDAAVEAGGRHRLPTDDLRGFLSRYFRDVADDDLRAWDPADVAGCGLRHHQLASRRAAGTASVRVYLPTVDEHGWSTGHTVVEIVNDDMPFLVDSVTAELSRQGRGIHLVIHPTFAVRRDDRGNLLEVLDGTPSTLDPGDGDADATGPADARVESWIHIEIDRVTDEAEVAALTSSLHRVLDDVRAAVDDWPMMRDGALTLERELRERAPVGLEDQAAEAGRFLDWLADENFTFLGYREYALADAGGEEVLRAVPGSGLGILRAGAKQDSESYSRLPARARAKARERRVLVLTKANSRATVHRPSYLDYVGVKSFDASGGVVGERRFLGLYSSAAYHESVRRVPILDAKVDAVLARSGFAPDSHSGKDLLAILETYPRDELFQVDVEELYETVLAVLRLQERRRTRLFLRREVYGRYMSALVFLPRDRYTTGVRLRIERILKDAFGAESVDHTTRVSESVLARLHFVLRVPPGQEVPDVDERRLESRLVEASRTWEEDLAESSRAEVSEEVAARMLHVWGDSFPEAYKEDFPARVAVGDLRRIDRLAAETRERAAGGDTAAVGRAFATNLYQPLDADPQERRFKLFRCAPLSLTAVLPFFRNLGVEVVDERPYHLRRRDGTSAWIYDFGLRFPVQVARQVDTQAAHAIFTEAFLAAWEGRSESDGLDQLVLRAGLTWRQVVILRAYTRYLRQAGSTFSQSYVESCLVANVAITRLLVRLFEARFQPAETASGGQDPTGADAAGRAEAVTALVGEIDGALDEVASLDHDRILRSLLRVVTATLRTNFYQPDAAGEPKRYASFKIDPTRLPELPEPRPAFEIWVYAPTVEGVHLRFGAVARGGLRWSDRREDFRTEVLGLVKAQMVKNAVIVPTGAKGGFVGKALPDPGLDRDAWLAEGVRCYQTFIRGLLDVTDNMVPDDATPGGRRVQPPPRVVRHDGDDPYLVVAADKGTASFSDIANAVSAEYGYWLGDAFASGGSVGYDHKAMGITARGAWESVKRHFRELGVDTQSDEVTVVGIGDMSGDVFGNGMLLSEHLRLVAAFDHRHIFLDPAPDPAASFAERRRLFALPRSSWADYEPGLISAGGGVYPRTAKSVPISPEVAEVLDLPGRPDHLTPAELLTAILAAPVDLLWNGGIGTYVKASTESHAEVGDKANDAIRVDGARLRARVVGEGGNLGFTQRGRIEAARSGVRINTDAIDNSAGVDCSDHEVNIKILLNGVVEEGDLTDKQRNRLLERMTDEVGRLVLRNNYEQNVLLGNARRQAPTMLHVHHQLLRTLEAAGLLDRPLEFLPDDAEIAARQERHVGLTSPELAVLVAYSKMTLATRLLGTTLPDEPWFRRLLRDYFPQPLVEQYGDRLESHPLCREIVTTCLVNDMVNRGGITFATRAAEETGAGVEQVARAYAVCREIFSLREFVAAVEALDNVVDVDVQTTMYLEFRRLLDRSVRWFLRNIRDTFDVATEIERFSPVTRRWRGRMGELLVGSERDRISVRAEEMLVHGVPQELAVRYAGLLDEFSLLDITETALRDAGTDGAVADADDVARLYFYLSERYGADTMLDRISHLERGDRWQALARGAMRDDLYAALEALTRSVLAVGGSGSVEERTAAWERENAGQLARTRQTIEEMESLERVELAPLSVALRSLRSVIRAGSD